MKMLIVRMYPDVININSYNCQELGLAKAMIKRGIQCDIVLYTNNKKSYEKDYIYDNKKIHIYYLTGKSIFKNCFFEKKLYKISQQYDVVQTAEYDQIANVKLKNNCKQMIIYHGPYTSSFTKKYNIKCFLSDIYFIFHPNYKKTTCFSKSELASDFLRKKGFKNVTTIGVGLDFDRFNSDCDETEIINKIKKEKKDNNLKFLLYIGRIEKRRNVFFIIDVLKEITNLDKNVKLLIVGNGDNKYVDKLFKYSKEIDVYNKIIYIKSLNQTQLSSLYNICDLFVLPTKYEIFGMVLLEALYFKIPVITTMNGGSSTIKSNLIKICDIDDEKKWANEALSIMYNKISDIDIPDLSWDTIVNKYLRIIKGDNNEK